MQFTDADPKMEDQHIQACAAEELSEFLQRCKKSCICSVLSRGLALLLQNQS